MKKRTVIDCGKIAYLGTSYQDCQDNIKQAELVAPRSKEMQLSLTARAYQLKHQR
jgi:hypothetical protein